MLGQEAFLDAPICFIEIVVNVADFVFFVVFVLRPDVVVVIVVVVVVVVIVAEVEQEFLCIGKWRCFERDSPIRGAFVTEFVQGVHGSDVMVVDCCSDVALGCNGL